jgi:hypothetical protein
LVVPAPVRWAERQELDWQLPAGAVSHIGPINAAWTISQAEHNQHHDQRG